MIWRCFVGSFLVFCWCIDGDLPVLCRCIDGGLSGVGRCFASFMLDICRVLSEVFQWLGDGLPIFAASLPVACPWFAIGLLFAGSLPMICHWIGVAGGLPVDS